jgi:ribosomal protein S17
MKMGEKEKELTIHDIECKIGERMEYLEKIGDRVRIAELAKLMDWILCGDDY